MKIPEFKEKFKKKYSKLLGDELNDFLDYSLKPLPKTIRVNTNKITKKELVEKLDRREWKFKELKYYDNGITIKEKNTQMASGLSS